MNYSRLRESTLRVCVCTSYPAASEPRAPRHAIALANIGDKLEVIFVDSAPRGITPRPVKVFEGGGNLLWQTHFYSNRAFNPCRLLLDRIAEGILRSAYCLCRKTHPATMSSRMLGFERLLEKTQADIYFGHNIDTLLPICRVARKRRARVMFDSMEFHSDMGDTQSATDKAIIRSIERQCLPQCALVLASSDQVADALVQEYGIGRPVPVYNMPAYEPSLPVKKRRVFALYWRNSTIGLGERGLDDALLSLVNLPAEITLHLQGRLSFDQGAAVKARIAELGISRRVFLHDPHQPDDAVKEAARYTVGLCLERGNNRNHELTVSNKIFDYHMAGLATVASDLSGLRSVIERSGGGLLFEPGSARDLTAKILCLYRNPELLMRLSENARTFAKTEGNREAEIKKFIAAFEKHFLCVAAGCN